MDANAYRQKSNTNEVANLHIPAESNNTNYSGDESSELLLEKIKSLNLRLSSGLANKIELLVQFDELEGWRSLGYQHCVAWISSELGISAQLGWEYLRVARKLRKLPLMRSLFEEGELTWSKVRLLTRVASDRNEHLLCDASLNACVSDVERICNDYRWNGSDEKEEKSEKERARKQFEARSLTWREAADGNTTIFLTLPAEQAKVFLNSIEYSRSKMERSEHSLSQKRADAAVLMAEDNFQTASRDVSCADRYQVVVSVDSADLASSVCTESTDFSVNDEKSEAADLVDSSIHEIPTKRPKVMGSSTIPRETARRIACDCTLSTIINRKGEPTDIGRKARVWPAAMARTIKLRDQHCQFPGCSQTRHLQIHHIQHWSDGGSTSVENGCCLCAYHHTLVHEGGYEIKRSNQFDPLEEVQNNTEKINSTRHRFEVFKNT